MTLMGVLSGIEMACWDILGKALNQPIYNLLGGQVHEKLRSVYENIDDYLLDMDVVSLYPTAMLEEYPIGESIETQVEVNGWLRQCLHPFWQRSPIRICIR